jgi:hypothetical protein
MATTQAPVLIVDEESGDFRLSIRLGMALRGELADEKTPVFYVSLAGFNLLKNRGDAAILQAYIEETHAGLVIIDALADIMLSGDENAVQDTQPVFAALRKIAEDTGAAILVIHHTNKIGEYRGSTAIPGAIDCMVLIDSEDASEFINFKTIKNRDGEPIQFSAQASWVDDQFYLTYAENQAGKQSYGRAQNYVLRYLAENSATPLQAIMAGADSCTAEGAKRAVYSLVDLGKVRRTNKDAPLGNEAIYELVPEESEE